MRYKIVEKASGEVLVYKRTESPVLIWEDEWTRIAGPFVCWNDAENYVKGQQLKQQLDAVVREEIIDV